MVAERRASENPLAGLRPLNAREDLRHRRRALTAAEIGRLMEAAKRGPACFGLSGPDRAMLYRLALETGLRAGELRSLAPESFDLDGPEPTVVVGAAYSKHRREDTLPLRCDTARALRDFLAGRPEGEPVLPWPAWLKPIKFFRPDLADAGIVYCDGGPSRRLSRLAAYVHHEPGAVGGSSQDCPGPRPAFDHRVDDGHLHGPDAGKRADGGRGAAGDGARGRGGGRPRDGYGRRGAGTVRGAESLSAPLSARRRFWAKSGEGGRRQKVPINQRQYE